MYAVFSSDRQCTNAFDMAKRILEYIHSHMTEIQAVKVRSLGLTHPDIGEDLGGWRAFSMPEMILKDQTATV